LERDLVGKDVDDKKVERIKELENLLDSYKLEMNSLIELNLEKKSQKAENAVDIHSTQDSSAISNLKNGNCGILL
jgi:hypothetical protein